MEENGYVDFEFSPTTLRQCKGRGINHSSWVLKTWMQMEDDPLDNHTKILIGSSTYIDSPLMCSISSWWKHKIKEYQTSTEIAALPWKRRDKNTRTLWLSFQDKKQPIHTQWEHKLQHFLSFFSHSTKSQGKKIRIRNVSNFRRQSNSLKKMKMCDFIVSCIIEDLSNYQQLHHIRFQEQIKENENLKIFHRRKNQKRHF